jgi:hypothetical protein
MARGTEVSFCRFSEPHFEHLYDARATQDADIIFRIREHFIIAADFIYLAHLNVQDSV